MIPNAIKRFTEYIEINPYMRIEDLFWQEKGEKRNEQYKE